MRDVLRRYKPTCVEDLTALNALYRPGPIQGGMIDDFIERKWGRRKVDYELPELEEILKETLGVIVYQEQVMQISNVLAGYSLGEADLLRRAMGKKNPAEMAKQRDRFVKGAIANRLSKEKVGHIFDLMEQFAGYGFNKSHSAAYALLAYHTAYLKTHYPVEFMAALLTSEISEARECRQVHQGMPRDGHRGRAARRADSAMRTSRRTAARFASVLRPSRTSAATRSIPSWPRATNWQQEQQHLRFALGVLREG